MLSAMDHDFLSDFSERWLSAWNSHDTERVMALLHPQIEWDDRTFWTHVMHGEQEVRAYVEKLWDVMHDVQFEEIQRFFAPDRLRGLVLFRQFGSGPRSLAPDRKFDTHGCDIFLEFKEGKLSRYLASYDIVDMMRQLGALPERGNKVGGAYLLSLMKQSGR